MITLREVKASVFGFCFGLILALVVFNLPNSGQVALSIFIQIAVTVMVVILIISIFISTILGIITKKKEVKQ